MMIKDRSLYLKCFVIFAVFILSACGDKQQQAPAEDQGRLVKTIMVGQASVTPKYAFPAKVAANQQVDLAFQVSGPLIEFPVKDGQQVKQGALLARIDPRDFKHALAEQEAILENTRLEYLRYKQLVEKKVVPQSDYDKKKAEYDIAQARTANAEKALADTYMYAPFTGVVARTYVENFQNVRAKEKILSLQEIDTVEIVINVPEQDIFHAKELSAQELRSRRDIATVVFDSLPEKKYPVQLKEYATEADPYTQTYEVKLMMPAPKDFNVLPGMSAKVYVEDDVTAKSSYWIPVTAVATNDQGQQYVWLVNMDSMTVAPQDVTVGNMSGDLINITQGLTAGERVVVAGTHNLQAGMKVRLYTSREEYQSK